MLLFLQEMKYIRQALLPVLMSCATSAGNLKTLEELLNQVSSVQPRSQRMQDPENEVEILPSTARV